MVDTDATDKISLLAFSAPSRRLAADATTVYVSATTGSDSNDGTQASPFKTLNRAQQSVGAGVRTVMVAPGTYYESLVFTPRDSGTSTQPVTWQASDPTQRMCTHTHTHTRIHTVAPVYIVRLVLMKHFLKGISSVEPAVVNAVLITHRICLVLLTQSLFVFS